MPRNGTKNLIPLNKRSKEVQRNIQEKGREANKIKHAQKTAAKEVAKMILYGNIPADSAKELVKKIGLPETEMNMQAAILAGTALEGIKGNVRATEYLMGLVGDSEAEENTIKHVYDKGIPLEISGGEFAIPYQYILLKKYSDYNFEGGRGSLKSTSCALFVIDQIERNPAFCALALRQVKDTLHDSVYSEIKTAIDRLNDFYPWMADDYKCTKSPMMITKKSTGQKIYFRGADDPGKIKSIKPPPGMHIGVVWIEEADQIKGDDAIRNIKQSAFRGGDDGILLKSYNVPRSMQHWINQEKLVVNPRRFPHHSHFSKVLPEWLGNRFIEDAERLKEINPTAYAHEYDGEAVGNGTEVFDNISTREITDSEINTFDNCYYGLDWGWVHPTAFMCVHYDPNRLRLYVYHEIYGSSIKNRELVGLLEPWKDCYITADSSSPKDIDALREWGINLFPAYKPPGSREYSTKWLASLAEIVIDPKRCPNAAREFIEYEYLKTKDGEITSLMPDVGEDAISAVRYAMSPVWSKRGQ